MTNQITDVPTLKAQTKNLDSFIDTINAYAGGDKGKGQLVLSVVEEARRFARGRIEISDISQGNARKVIPLVAMDPKFFKELGYDDVKELSPEQCRKVVNLCQKVIQKNSEEIDAVTNEVRRRT